MKVTRGKYDTVFRRDSPYDTVRGSVFIAHGQWVGQIQAQGQPIGNKGFKTRKAAETWVRSQLKKGQSSKTHRKVKDRELGL